MEKDYLQMLAQVVLPAEILEYFSITMSSGDVVMARSKFPYFSSCINALFAFSSINRLTLG